MRRLLFLSALAAMAIGVVGGAVSNAEELVNPEGSAAFYHLKTLKGQRSESGRMYLSFLDVEAMSAGLYEIAAGDEDPQSPHGRDEIYVIMSGQARIRVDGETRPATKGSVIYVARGVSHRFEDIKEDLTVLVIFAGEVTE